MIKHHLEDCGSNFRGCSGGVRGRIDRRRARRDAHRQTIQFEAIHAACNVLRSHARTSDLVHATRDLPNRGRIRPAFSYRRGFRHVSSSVRQSIHALPVHLRSPGADAARRAEQHGLAQQMANHARNVARLCVEWCRNEFGETNDAFSPENIGNDLEARSHRRHGRPPSNRASIKPSSEALRRASIGQRRSRR